MAELADAPDLGSGTNRCAGSTPVIRISELFERMAHFFSDILIRQKTEVCAMVLTEYNEKRHMRSLYQNGYNSGYDGGYDQGTAETRRQTIISMLNNGLSPELIREYTGYDREVISMVSDDFYCHK